MILDYVEKTGKFVARVPRAQGQLVQSLIIQHGFDFFRGSGPDEALLATGEPYAAVTFFEHGTAAARARLGALHQEIAASWAPESKAHIRVPDGCELWPFQKANVAYALQRRHTLV